MLQVFNQRLWLITSALSTTPKALHSAEDIAFSGSHIQRYPSPGNSGKTLRMWVIAYPLPRFQTVYLLPVILSGSSSSCGFGIASYGSS